MKITLKPCGRNVEELKCNDLQNTVYFADGVTFANGKKGQIEISRTAKGTLFVNGWYADGGFSHGINDLLEHFGYWERYPYGYTMTEKGLNIPYNFGGACRVIEELTGSACSVGVM